MSIATHALKYGWVYLASLTFGAGTIFVADSTLRRITLHDRVEIALAVAERCLATQTGTNADGTPVYAVDPPSIVRTWTDTNGASVTMTNAFEWGDDLSMKVELDAKLKAVCPYYVDTSSVYDGTTNIIMLTFTGLLVSLDLGDHTNFTSIPAIGTNAATFGPWAWRNYVVAWQERYKVLNALKYMLAYNSADPFGTNLFPKATAFTSTSVQELGKFSWAYMYDTRFYVGWDYVEDWSLYYWNNSPAGAPFQESWSIGKWGSDIDYAKYVGGAQSEFINASRNQGWAIATVSILSEYYRPVITGILVTLSPGNSTGDVYDTFSDDLTVVQDWTNNTYVMNFGSDTNVSPEIPGFPSGKPPIGWGVTPPSIPEWGLQRYARGYKGRFYILVDMTQIDTNAPEITNEPYSDTNLWPRSFRYCTDKYW